MSRLRQSGSSAWESSSPNGRSACPRTTSARCAPDDGKSLRVFVNGTPQTGNPAAILFKAHDEVAVVYGTPQPSETIPSKYEFAEGECRAAFPAAHGKDYDLRI